MRLINKDDAIHAFDSCLGMNRAQAQDIIAKMPEVDAEPLKQYGALQEIRQEIKDLNEYQFQEYGIDRYLNAYEVKAIIDRHIKEFEG